MRDAKLAPQAPWSKPRRRYVALDEARVASLDQATAPWATITTARAGVDTVRLFSWRSFPPDVFNLLVIGMGGFPETGGIPERKVLWHSIRVHNLTPRMLAQIDAIVAANEKILLNHVDIRFDLGFPDMMARWHWTTTVYRYGHLPYARNVQKLAFTTDRGKKDRGKKDRGKLVTYNGEPDPFGNFAFADYSDGKRKPPTRNCEVYRDPESAVPFPATRLEMRFEGAPTVRRFITRYFQNLTEITKADPAEVLRRYVCLRVHHKNHRIPNLNTRVLWDEDDWRG